MSRSEYRYDKCMTVISKRGKMSDFLGGVNPLAFFTSRFSKISCRNLANWKAGQSGASLADRVEVWGKPQILNVFVWDSPIIEKKTPKNKQNKSVKCLFCQWAIQLIPMGVDQACVCFLFRIKCVPEAFHCESVSVFSVKISLLDVELSSLWFIETWNHILHSSRSICAYSYPSYLFWHEKFLIFVRKAEMNISSPFGHISPRVVRVQATVWTEHLHAHVKEWRNIPSFSTTELWREWGIDGTGLIWWLLPLWAKLSIFLGSRVCALRICETQSTCDRHKMGFFVVRKKMFIVVMSGDKTQRLCDWSFFCVKVGWSSKWLKNSPCKNGVYLLQKQTWLWICYFVIENIPFYAVSGN